VLHGLLQHVPWGAFDRLVDEHGGDKGTRTLSMRTQFVSLAFGQLSGASSLREIEGGASQPPDQGDYRLSGARNFVRTSKSRLARLRLNSADRQSPSKAAVPIVSRFHVRKSA
jgi:hypothetical protein